MLSDAFRSLETFTLGIATSTLGSPVGRGRGAEAGARMAGGDVVAGTITVVGHVGEFDRWSWSAEGSPPPRPEPGVSTLGARELRTRSHPGCSVERARRDRLSLGAPIGHIGVPQRSAGSARGLRRASRAEARRECSEPTTQVCPSARTPTWCTSPTSRPCLRRTGAASRRGELRKMASEGASSRPVIEVCPDCSWNHLARSFVLLPPGRLDRTPCGSSPTNSFPKTNMA